MSTESRAAQAYLASAGTPHQQRERQKEVEAQGWDLVQKYGATLDDDSPNPKHDKALYDRGMELILVTMGLRRKGSTSTSSPGATPGLGYHSKRCWCDRPCAH
jgi:hypothetical protein